MLSDASNTLNELKSIELRERPHVVVLGAGASFAATPTAEKHNRQLPLMKDLPHSLDLRDLLGTEFFNRAVDDFEAVFDSLVSAGETSIVEEIQERTFSYFDSFELSEETTLYDRLVLSLRAKDTIVSFNWDPLLPYAYRRNGHLGTLPSLWFLHGNVKSGYCPNDKVMGWNDDKCLECGGELVPTPLLYPVSQKDYESHPVLAEAWKHFEHDLIDAYFITVFGYSAPKTDVAARSRFVDRLRENKAIGLLQLEIIDPNAEILRETTFADIHKDLHISCLKHFSQSWLTTHARLSCEALYQATLMMHPIRPYPIPETADLNELHAWYNEFSAFFPAFFEEVPPWVKR